MNPSTATVAITLARMPLRMESAPRSGPTVRSSTTVNATGSLPERSAMESSLALATVKLPEICAEPPRIGSLMLGAERTTRSEEHTSELQSLMRISYAVFCLKNKQENISNTTQIHTTTNKNK